MKVDGLIRVMRHPLWIVLTVAYLTGANASAQEDVIETFRHAKSHPIDAGLYTVHVLEIKNPRSRFDGVTVLWIQIPRDKVQVSIENIAKPGRANEIYRQNSSGDELVVLSAGFHDSKNRPVGLFVSHGNVISRLAPWTAGGILYQSRNDIGIVPIEQWKLNLSELEYAIQAKPLVVEDGRNGILANDGLLFDRVGIGFTIDGNLLVCGAFRSRNHRALSLYDFGRLMASSTLGGGPRARTVLGVEGGPGAHIYLPRLKRHFGRPGLDFVMSAIHVRQKRKAQ